MIIGDITVPFKPLSWRGGSHFKGIILTSKSPMEDFSANTDQNMTSSICQLSSGWCILPCQRRAWVGFCLHTRKKTQTCQSNVWKKKVWNKKPAYSWHLPQSWYHTSVPVQGKYTLCFCKKCNKMSLWHTFGRAISKCWLKSVYLQRAIWSLNSTQSNLQWFWCGEAKPLMSNWGLHGRKNLLQKI